MAIEVNGKSLETDEEGYLANLNDWEKDVATVMAKEDDIDLSEDHWEIINFLREYYEEYQIAPAVRVLTKAVGKKLGKDKGNIFTNMFKKIRNFDGRPGSRPTKDTRSFEEKFLYLKNTLDGRDQFIKMFNYRIWLE